MHLSTHRLIGLWLIRQLSEEEARCLPRISFLIGNLKPDFHRKGPGRRHVFEDTRLCLETKMNQLLGGAQGRHLAAVAMGELCHHIADTFCHYHHDLDQFADRRQHFLYEMRLQHWFSKELRKGVQPKWAAPSEQPEGLRDPSSAEGLMRHLERQRTTYDTQSPCFETDMTYTLRNALAVLRPMLSHNRHEQMPQTAVAAH